MGVAHIREYLREQVNVLLWENGLIILHENVVNFHADREQLDCLECNMIILSLWDLLQFRVVAGIVCGNHKAIVFENGVKFIIHMFETLTYSPFHELMRFPCFFGFTTTLKHLVYDHQHILRYAF